WQYGLKVATIQYQNKITGEKIKLGQKLTLPPGDVSATVIAKAKAKEQAAQNKKLLASATTSSRRLTTREKASGYTGDESGGGFVKPMNYNYISRRLQRGHTGTDMIAPVGTTVVAAKGGKVIEVSYGWSGGYGIMILIDHGGGVKTRYAHLSNAKVSAGEIVGAGEVIAASGNTGRSTGAHLHFEVISGGRYQAPF
ncbi:MAG TPA: M23 family metallopeptidase, partial [Patescibacteria group bacterium]|nr:M23 family metallopeptidase [Patescibacteria group bacterium]